MPAPKIIIDPTPDKKGRFLAILKVSGGELSFWGSSVIDVFRQAFRTLRVAQRRKFGK